MANSHLTIESVIELGLELPDVEVSTYFRARALKLNGRMLACTPVSKSAEANSAVIAMGLERRAELLKENPALYYITDHYGLHPTMLARLSTMSRAELERTLRMAWDYLSSTGPAQRQK